jgi:hypothetical protein
MRDPNRETSSACWGVFFLLLGIYILFLGAELGYTKDANPIIAVTNTFLVTGSFAYPLNGDPPYSMYGLGMSVWYTPIRMVLELIVPKSISEDFIGFWFRLGYIFLNVLGSAGIGAFLVKWALDLGVSRGASILGALCYGTATLQLPYARYDFSEPVVGFFLLGGFYYLWRSNRIPNWRNFLYAGLFLGAGALTRVSVGFLAVFGAVPVLLGAYRRKDWKGAASFFAPLVFTLITIFWYNYARFDDPFETGYPISFEASLLEGIAGLLLSPGRGLLFYSPVAIMGLVAFFVSAKTGRLTIGLVGLSLVLFLTLHGKWTFWHGGWCWGPRFLLPLLPFSGLGFAYLFDKPSLRLIGPVLLFGTGWLINGLAIYTPYTDFFETAAVNKFPEQALLWEWKYSLLRVHHEYLSQVHLLNYDFLFLNADLWGRGVYGVALAGIVSLGVGIWGLRRSYVERI